jgi:hypothetical protein
MRVIAAVPDDRRVLFAASVEPRILRGDKEHTTVVIGCHYQGDDFLEFAMGRTSTDVMSVRVFLPDEPSEDWYHREVGLAPKFRAEIARRQADLPPPPPPSEAVQFVDPVERVERFVREHGRLPSLHGGEASHHVKFLLREYRLAQEHGDDWPSFLTPAVSQRLEGLPGWRERVDELGDDDPWSSLGIGDN